MPGRRSPMTAAPFYRLTRPVSPRSGASAWKYRSARPACGKRWRMVVTATPVLLFRGLDGGRRALRLAVVDRIEEVPVSAIKRALAGLRVQSGRRDPAARGRDRRATAGRKVRLFRLNDGSHEIGCAFAEVIDFAAIRMTSSAYPDRLGEVSGVSLINGEPAELVSARWLFSSHVGPASRAKEQMVCLIPDGTRGCRTCSVPSSRRPAMSSATMLTRKMPTSSSRRSGRSCRRRRQDDLAAHGARGDEQEDNSIYRYDRAGLLVALKSVGSGGAGERALAGRHHCG